MAKQRFALPPTPASVANDPNISQGLKNDFSNYQQTAQNEINTGSFRARHPVASTIGNALIGGALMGPSGAFLMPMLAAKGEQKRVNGIAEAYQNALKNRSEIENNLLNPRMAANRGHSLNQSLENNGIQSPLSDYTQLDPETAKTLLNGYTAGDTYRMMQQDQNTAMHNGMRNALSLIPGAPQSSPVPPVNNGQPYIAAGAEYQQQAPPSPLRPAIYHPPEMLNKGLENQQQILSTALQQAPNYTKLPSEIQKIHSGIMKDLQEGNLAAAHTKLVNLKAKYYPQLTQSVINKNNRPTVGRAPGVIDLMTPQQRAQYAARMAVGPDNSGYESTSVTTDKDGKVLSQTKTTRAKGGVASNTKAVDALVAKYKPNPRR